MVLALIVLAEVPGVQGVKLAGSAALEATHQSVRTCRTSRPDLEPPKHRSYRFAWRLRQGDMGPVELARLYIRSMKRPIIEAMWDSRSPKTAK